MSLVVVSHESMLAWSLGAMDYLSVVINVHLIIYSITQSHYDSSVVEWKFFHIIDSRYPFTILSTGGAARQSFSPQARSTVASHCRLSQPHYSRLCTSNTLSDLLVA